MMSPSGELPSKGLAIAWGQQYAKESAIFVAFSKRVAGLLATLPGATIVENRKNELEFKFLGRTHLLAVGFLKTDSGFQSQVTLRTPDRGETDGRAVSESIKYDSDGRVMLAGHSYGLRDDSEAIFLLLLTGNS